MTGLRFTLLSDGSSDRVLLPILRWVLIEQGGRVPIQSEWANLGRLPVPPEGLVNRIRASLEYYPCDALFIHRDAEGESYGERKAEVQAAIEAIPKRARPRSVCVVPVRMTEAWLLFDEAAIRKAAGNPVGAAPLRLPKGRWDQIPNPKRTLHDALRRASGLTGRRRKRFNAASSAHRIPDSVSGFAPLRSLSAFQALERDIAELVEGTPWSKPHESS